VTDVHRIGYVMLAGIRDAGGVTDDRIRDAGGVTDDHHRDFLFRGIDI
jgi:hypothetical protein